MFQLEVSVQSGQSASVYLDEDDLVKVISNYRRTETEVAQIKANRNGTVTHPPVPMRSLCVLGVDTYF